MNEWISVKDRLPEEGVEILVYGVMECQRDPDIHKAKYNEFTESVDGVRREGIVKQFWDSCWGEDLFDVTHWMPLPLPPKE